jgi:hypothetical protein
MRLNAACGLQASVVPKFNARRLQLRIGPAYKFTLTESEAIDLATQLVAGVDTLHADQLNHRNERNQP